MRKIFVSVLLTASAVLGLLRFSDVRAVTGSNFDPGMIISDSVFYDSMTMSVDEIQTFLEDMVDSNGVPDGIPGECDSDGSESYAGTTRADYSINHAANGTPPPFICLPNYYENPTTGANNYWAYVGGEFVNTGGAIPSGAISASQIIYNAAQYWRVNPRVLLVLLQKEQSLLTDDWPWGIQYQKATGYGCPDTAPCNEDYYGFYNQVHLAASQFRHYRDSPGDHNFLAGQNNTILYNPNVACGSSTVFIQNQATAGLYNYTPYQPNAAALANVYGSGDGCSAYGNRNFWRIFNDWFGSTVSSDPNVAVTSSLVVTPTDPIADEVVTATFRITNYEDFPVNFADMVTVAARSPSGRNVDFPLDTNVIIPANGTYTYAETKTFRELGTYNVYVAVYRDGYGWSSTSKSGYPRVGDDSVTKAANFAVRNTEIYVTTGLSVTPTDPTINEPVTVTFTVTNNEDVAINIGSIVVVAARDSSGNNVDFPAETDVIVPAGGTYTYSQTRSFGKAGNYTILTASYRPTYGWYLAGFPRSQNAGIVRSLTLNVREPIVKVTTGLELSPANPRVQQNVTATFTVTNNEDVAVYLGKYILVAARDPSGRNVDFPADVDVTIPANSTYTYSKTKIFGGTYDASAVYNMWIATYRTDRGWSFSPYPASASSGIVRSLNQTIRAMDLTVTTGLSVTPTDPTINEPVTVTFTVTNNEDVAINIGSIVVVAARDSSGNNVDFPAETDVIVPAGGTYTYSQTRSFGKAGNYTILTASYRPTYGWYLAGFPRSQNAGIVRSLTLNVREPIVKVTTGLELSPANPRVQQNVTATFTVTNNEDVAVYLGKYILVAARDPSGRNVDFPADVDVTIPANSTYTYSKTKIFGGTYDASAVYNMWIATYRTDRGWSFSPYPASASSGIVRSLNQTIRAMDLTVTTGLSVTPTDPTINEPVTVTFTVTNNEDVAINIGSIVVVAARDSSGNNVDFPAETDVIVPAGGTYTYSQTRSFGKAGNYTILTASYRPTYGWYLAGFPRSQNAGIVRSLTLNVREPIVKVTTGLELSPANPRVQQNVTATFTVTNNEDVAVYLGKYILVAARDPSGRNVDFPADVDVTIPANSTYTYSKTKIFGGTYDASAVYNMWIATYRTDRGWSFSPYPASASSGIVRSLNQTIRAMDLTVTTGLSVTPTDPTINEPVTVTFTVTNNEDVAINIGSIVVVAARDSSGNNVDFPAETDVIVPAGGTYTYSQTRSFGKAGNYTILTASYRPTYGWYLAGFPRSQNAGIVRSLTLNVREPIVKVTTGLELTPVILRIGEDVTATFTVTNYEEVPVYLGKYTLVAARDPSGRNVDFPADVDVTILAGGTYTYTATRTFGTGGFYTMWTANFREDQGWNFFDYPASFDSTITRSVIIEIK